MNLVELIVTLIFKTVMYENEKPFFTKSDVMVLRESIISIFDTCVTMVMEFNESFFEVTKW